MEQQCQLAEVSRVGFYRSLQQTAPKQADLLLRARLQELAVAHHRLRGYRMLTALLRREGHLINHKRVLRLMRRFVARREWNFENQRSRNIGMLLQKVSCRPISPRALMKLV